MKTKIWAAIASLAVCLAACDDTTDSIGQSLTDNMDHLHIVTDTFKVTTRSIVADSVLSRNTTGYLGKIKDPETGAYITGDFMLQFNTLENDTVFPEKDRIMSLDQQNGFMADSCEIRLFFSDYYGDSLAVMKVEAMEMDAPMKENVKYYSNFNPEKEGYIRSNGLRKSKVYTITDQSVSEEYRNSSNYSTNLRIPLNEPYTDKNNVTYSNYGTYLMSMYYEHPEYFKNSYTFTHNVCPGFYIKMKDGIGSMAYVYMGQLNVYFNYKTQITGSDDVKRDTIISAFVPFSGTEEVLQTTNITNDKETIKQLAAEKTCTYLKTPAGIFTEMTLPVEEIMRNHENDTLNTAKVVLTRINNSTHNKYALDTPSALLMIPRDSIHSFFENGNVTDNKISFLATTADGSYTLNGSYNTKNTYIYNNISSLITKMAEQKSKGQAKENWNKVVLVPVNITTDASGAIVNIVHDMSLTSTKLVGGSENPYDDIKISVIYSKFSDK